MVVKPAKPLFNSFCSDVAKQVARFIAPIFYPITTKILDWRFQRRVPYYRKLFLINPWLKHLRKGFGRAYIRRGHISGIEKALRNKL